MRGLRGAISFVVLSAALGQVAAVAAEPSCEEIDARILVHQTKDGCTSPAGYCTVGNIDRGPLAGTTRFTAHTVAPMPIHGSPQGVLRYTGELVVTTAKGTVTLTDVGLFHTTKLLYTETQGVMSGTGSFAGTRGLLWSFGTAPGGSSFDGRVTGKICRSK
jgi:hypothetical protein